MTIPQDDLENNSPVASSDVGSMPDSEHDVLALRSMLSLYHEIAKGTDGLMVLSARKPSQQKLKSHHFEVGDIDGMMSNALRLSQAGHNVWMPLVVYRRNLKAGSRGQTTDIIAVLGFVGDSDADTGNVVADSAVVPTLSVITSRTNVGINYHRHFALTKPISVAQAEPVAAGLKVAFGGDNDSWVINQLYALPCTLNWPTSNKIERGRSPEPQMRTLDGEIGKMWDVDELFAALPECEVGVETNVIEQEIAADGDAQTDPVPQGEIDAAEIKPASKRKSKKKVPADASPKPQLVNIYYWSSTVPFGTMYLPEKVEAIVVRGDTSRFKSRSEALWFAICKLLEQGVEPKDIKSVLLDPKNEISSYVREKGERDKAGKWLDAQIAKALAGGKPIPREFECDMPTHKFMHTPTMRPWPAKSVDRRLRAIEVDREVYEFSDRTTELRPIRESASEWLAKRRPVETLCWAPGESMMINGRFLDGGGWRRKNGVRTLNTYRPPTIKLGDANQAGPWVELVQKMYPEEAEHLLNYFAHTLQRPHEKINHAPVLGGKQGIGKDTWLQGVVMAIGPWNAQEVSPQDVNGDFKPWMQAVMLRVSETRDQGEGKRLDKFAFYNTMKTYEATPPDALLCNTKYTPQVYVQNIMRVVYTTNHKADGMYFPADDRRHFVAWSNLSKDDFDKDYFIEFWKWYEAGGYGHVAAYLRQRDISKFDPKAAPPKTAAFQLMVHANRAPESNEMATVLEELGNPDAVTIELLAYQAFMLRMSDFKTWLEDRSKRKLIAFRLEEAGYTFVANPSNAEGRWKVKGKNTTIYAKADLPEGKRQEAAAKGPVPPPLPWILPLKDSST